MTMRIMRGVMLGLMPRLMFGLLMLLAAGMIYAQPARQQFTYTATDPAGACANGQANQYNYILNKEWGCNNSVWTVVASGGGGGGGSPAGSDTWLQFNNMGAFGASANFTYDATKGPGGGQLVVGGPLPPDGPFAFSTLEALIALGSDVGDIASLGYSDGYAGGSYLAGIVAAMGDVNPMTGTAATTGHSYLLGSLNWEINDTTNADTSDWLIQSASTTASLRTQAAGNSAGDVALGAINMGFGATPTTLTDSNFFVKGDGSLVSMKGNLAIATASPIGSANAAVCWKTTTKLSYCTSAVGVGGTCTCN